MNNRDTVFIGDVALDEYYNAPYFPLQGDKVGVEAMEAQMGGMIANAACVYASYGDPIHFMSILNHRDKKLCDNLNQQNINTDMVIYDDRIADSKCLIFLVDGQHTVFILHRGIEVIEIPPEVQQRLCQCGVIYSNYMELRHLRCGDLDACGVLAQWQSAGVKLVCDIDVAELDEETHRFFAYTDILYMNEIGFANQTCGRSTQETVDYILQSGVRILVVTLGEKGCIIYSKDESISIQGIPVEVKDVTGAGDTFCSTFTWLYYKTGDIRLAANFATYAGALSVTHMGARGGAVGSQAVLDFMLEKGVDITTYQQAIGGGQR